MLLTPVNRLIARWHWLIPPLMLLATAPVWLALYEPELFYFLNWHLSVVPAQLWAFLSLMGTGWCIYAFTAPSLWLAPRVIVSWLCAAPVAGALTRVGKGLLDHPRPLEVLDPALVQVIGEPLFVAAMPSGHTITGFAAAAAIYFSLQPETRLKYLWLFVLALGVGLSRIAVGAHWPADVVVGAAIGVFSGLTGAWLCARIKDRHLSISSWWMRGVALFGIYCLYVLLTDEMGFVQNMPEQYLLSAYLLVCLISFLWQSFRPDRKPFSDKP